MKTTLTPSGAYATISSDETARGGSTGMSVSDASSGRPHWTEALGVYLRPRVLIVLFLGFSSGLPLALTASTLTVWMREVGVNLETIGLFGLVGTPYALKFFWAPLVDALDVPVLSNLLGRRRGWLLLTQLLLMGAISFLAFCDPVTNPWQVAFGALLVAIASATQDIVIDTFRVESLDQREQAAGQAAYVAAYRIGMLVSTAGVLYLVSAFEAFNFSKHAAWVGGYLAMTALVIFGVITTLAAQEPERSAVAEQLRADQTALRRLITTVIGAFQDFFSREGVPTAILVLLFVVLFKFTDALAGKLTPAFVIDLGFSRDVYATIIKGVGLIATLAGGFVGGFVVKSYPLGACLWVGGIIQALANFAFSWQAIVGAHIGWLTFAIVVENFTGGVGTVIFVAYLAALCRNPLHTATQIALLTALSMFGPIFLSSGAGYMVVRTGYALFFAICVAAALPSFMLLAYLQRRGHFIGLAATSTPQETA